MGEPIKLLSPRYRIVMGDWADESTWTVYELQAIGKDMQMATGLFARHKEWGAATADALKLQAVTAWYASRRTGQFTGTWAEFENGYLEITDVGSEEAGPTLPEPEID